MDTRSLGFVLIAGGIVAVVLGALIMTGALSWFGRLPGDIRFEGENTRVYFPITSMVLLSVAVSAVMYVLRRLF